MINTIQVTDTLEVRLTMALPEAMDSFQIKLPVQLGAEPRRTNLHLVPLNDSAGCDTHVSLQYQAVAWARGVGYPMIGSISTQ